MSCLRSQPLFYSRYIDHLEELHHLQVPVSAGIHGAVRLENEPSVLDTLPSAARSGRQTLRLVTRRVMQFISSSLKELSSADQPALAGGDHSALKLIDRQLIQCKQFLKNKSG
jgi:hypothetical protein